MSYQTVTIHLSQEIYQQARRTAHLVRCPVEQVVADWVQPPPESAVSQEATLEELLRLEDLSDDELIHEARFSVPPDAVSRLQELFVLQRQRKLSSAEWQDLTTLVEREDRLTLRKARSLFLLKQRGALPTDLIAFFTQISSTKP